MKASYNALTALALRENVLFHIAALMVDAERLMNVKKQKIILSMKVNLFRDEW